MSQPTWCVVVCLKKLVFEKAVVHAIHAGRESGFVAPSNGCPPWPTPDECVDFRGATKEQLLKLHEELTAAGIPHKLCDEIHGELAGTFPSLGVATTTEGHAAVVAIMEKLGIEKFRFPRLGPDAIYEYLRRLPAGERGEVLADLCRKVGKLEEQERAGG